MCEIDLSPYLEQAKKYTDKDIFGIFLYGSQNYGLNNAESDIDVRCLIFPDDQNSPLIETVDIILDNEERIEFMDIRTMFLGLCEGNLPLLETLYTQYYIIDDKYKTEWLQLKERLDEIAYLNPSKFLQNLQINAIVTIYRYHNKLAHPKLLAKCGYAGKSLHHLFRLKDIYFRYLSRESFKTIFNANNKSILIDIKRGRWKRAQADAALRELEQFFDFEIEAEPTPDDLKTEIQDIIYKIYEKRGWK